MKQNDTKAIREGAMMIALTVVLILLTWYVPLFSFIGMFVCGVPMACMAARNSDRFAIIAVIGVFAVTFLVTFDLLSAASLMLLSVVPGAVAGRCMRKGTSFFSALFMTCLMVCLGMLLVVYAINSLMQGNGLNAMMDQSILQIERMVETYLSKIPPEMIEANDAKNLFNEMVESMRYMLKLYLPSLVVLSAILTGYAIYMLCTFFVKRLKLAVVDVVPFSMLKAPRGMCFIAVILYLISMFTDSRSTFRAVSANVILILYTIIGICGFSLVDYWFSKVVHKGILRAVIYVATFLFGGILMGIASNLLIMAGIIDSSYNFRKIAIEEEPYDGGDGGGWA